MFSRINPFYPDVVVKRFPREHKPIDELLRNSKLDERQLRRIGGKKYLSQWNQFLKYNSAQIGVDLHDDIPAKLRPDYHVQEGYSYIPRTEARFHFCNSKSNREHELYENRIELKISKFKRIWNQRNKFETFMTPCSCYEVYKRGCNLPLVSIEFHNLDERIPTTFGVKYLGTLVRYLLAEF